MKSYSNKVAAITGAGSGMGRSLAVKLAERNCHIAISDVHEENLAERDGVADVARELFDAEPVALRHSILLSARFDDRVHREALLVSRV